MKNLLAFVKNFVSFSKSRITLVLVVLLATLIASLTIIHNKYIQEKARAERLDNNIRVLKSELNHYATTDGLRATEVGTLTVTVSELKEQNKEYINELNTLKIKARDVSNLQKISASADYTFGVIPADTVVMHDTLRISQKTYRYNDDWIRFEMLCDLGSIDSCRVQVATVDSLLIVHHAKTKRFLWWTWKRYSGKTTIKNYNPYSTITGIENMDVIK